MRTRNATDLGLNLDRFAAPSRAMDVDWIYLQGAPGWVFDGHADCHFGYGPCPCCSGLPLRRTCYCLGCDRTGLDDKVTFPGLDVDYAPDPEWRSEGTIYSPDPTLAGGVQPRPARLRRGVVRAKSRKAG